MMNFPSEFLVPTLISFSIGIFFYAIIYMLGNIMQRKEVKGLATESFADLATVSLYIIIAFMIFGFINNVTPGMLGFGDYFDSYTSDPEKTGFQMTSDLKNLPIIELGEAYLSIMFYQGEKLYRSMLIQISYASLLTSLEIGAGGGEKLAFFRGLEAFLNFAPALLTSASVMLMTFSAQLFLLKFFIVLVPKIFFPMGILFRVLHPTKSFGGGILALSFTLYFIYPLFLSFNFLIMVNLLGASNLQLDSYIYNSPQCSSDDECNSGECVPAGGVSYCKPCIFLGEIPEGSILECCAKSSKLDEGFFGNKCVLDFPDDFSVDTAEGEEMMKAKIGNGGIITSSQNFSDSILFAVFAVVAVALLCKVLIAVFATTVISSLVGLITGTIGMIFGVTVGAVSSVPGLNLALHPVVTFVGLLLLNSKFFFLGFILPIIQFIILVEFVRVLTGSMGESIDIMDLFKVI